MGGGTLILALRFGQLWWDPGEMTQVSRETYVACYQAVK